jgi:hypothetical protein
MAGTQPGARGGMMARILAASYPDRRTFFKDLLALNSITMAVWAFWGFHFSLFARMGQLLRANPDSASYIAFCDWIFGHGAATSATLQRTFLYPLLLGIKFAAGDAGIWALQCLLLLAAINMLALAVHEWSTKRVLVQAAFLIVAMYPTFFLMTFSVLTEILTVFLLTLWLFLSSRALKNGGPTDSSAFTLMLLAGFLAVTKPVFLPFFMFLGLLMLAGGFKPRRLLLFLLACLPLACQVGINVRLHQRAVFSRIGATALDTSFLPQLLAQVRYEEKHPGQGGSPVFDHAGKEPLRLEVLSWPQRQKIVFLVRHWPLAAKVFLANIFRENMTQGVSLLPIRPFYYGTKLFNLAALLLHFYMFPMILLIFFRKFGLPANRIWLALNLSLFALLAASTGTVYWQGERYVFIMIPLWATIYAASFSLLKGKIRLTE